MYDRNVRERTLSFGVSGRLYQGNLLLYDRQTDSLWSQITAKAVAGRMTGAKLGTIPFMITTWREWRQQYPHGRVATGRRVPAIFSALGKTLQTLFSPLGGLHWPLRTYPRTALDDLVLGVTVGEVQKAYPLEMLARVTSLTDTIEGTGVRIVFVPGGEFAYAEKITGERLPSVVTYRVTWTTFYPYSRFYTAP